MQRIEPATLAFDAGAPFSPRYGDVYASRDGALEQARHVFLGGNDLPRRWAGRSQFVIVETGFGLGVNFMAAWHAWRADAARPRRLHFVSIERHPLRAADLMRAAPPALHDCAAELASRWPPVVPGLHRLEFERGGVTLTLALGDALELAPRLVLGADTFFLDGFAPERNPEMWSPRLLKALARLARPGATLATWCTARPVREALQASGFETERRPGFGRKREMLAARFAPRYCVRRHEPPAPYAGERRAVVIGAGLAGSAAAHALARRGWQVGVVEQGVSAAAGASALPWGLLHPQVSSDDGVLARLTRAGFLWSRSLLDALSRQDPGVWQPSGVLHLARSDACAAAFAATLERLGVPAEFAAAVSAEQASALAGVAVRRGGLWFAGAGIAAPARVCHALLAAPGIALHRRSTAARLTAVDGHWSALDAEGRVAGSAPVLIVAAALSSPALLGLAHAPVQAVRGRISLLRPRVLAGLRAALSGDGIVLRAPDGQVAAGATYETAPSGAGPTDELDAAAVHRGNEERLRRMLALSDAVEPIGLFDGVRCVSRDRLPLAGVVADEAAALAASRTLRGAHLADLPRRPGLFASFAFGSRGLALAPVAAELVAAQIEGEPWPVDRSLAAAIDPARFLLRRLRTG